jgi:hypothetical protein
MTEFLRIAWPGLLVLAAFLVLIVVAARQHRRRYPRARYRATGGVREALARNQARNDDAVAIEKARLAVQQARDVIGIAWGLAGRDCEHGESLYGRCVVCGMTWAARRSQALARSEAVADAKIALLFRESER